MTQLPDIQQEKVLFIWNEPRPRVHVPSRLELRPMQEGQLAVFAAAVERVLEGSLDEGDRARVSRSTARDVAWEYARPDPRHFTSNLAWWQLAYATNEALVGFSQPVLYRGCAKDGLEEGTIHYLGVLPEHRGHGYIVDLLCAATRTLQDVGVWRIYCDTDVRNLPMIRAFQEVGYEQGENRMVTHRFETS